MQNPQPSIPVTKCTQAWKLIFGGHIQNWYEASVLRQTKLSRCVILMCHNGLWHFCTNASISLCNNCYIIHAKEVSNISYILLYVCLFCPDSKLTRSNLEMFKEVQLAVTCNDEYQGQWHGSAPSVFTNFALIFAYDLGSHLIWPPKSQKKIRKKWRNQVSLIIQVVQLLAWSMPCYSGDGITPSGPITE